MSFKLKITLALISYVIFLCIAVAKIQEYRTCFTDTCVGCKLDCLE